MIFWGSRMYKKRSSIHEAHKIEQSDEINGKTDREKLEFGMTPSYLFMKVKDDLRCMIMLFVIISLIILVSQLGALGFWRYLFYSLVIALVLSVIWWCLGVFITGKTSSSK